MGEIEQTSRLPLPENEVRAWLARPAALQRLLPPWAGARVPSPPTGGAGTGGGTFALRQGLVPVRWLVSGGEADGDGDRPDSKPPPALWLISRLDSRGAAETDLHERVICRRPEGAAGWAVSQAALDSLAGRWLRFRQQRLREDLQRHAPLAGRPRLRVAIGGASGLIGRNLALFLAAGGHDVQRLVRRPPQPGGGEGEIFFNPAQGQIDAAALEGCDAVVHLAGAGIADGRWGAARKKSILQSRVETTRFLSQALTTLRHPPRLLLVASATGYYGNRGEEPLDEDSGAGEGFLAQVCGQWEAAAQPARAAGIRVVHLRMGMVLTPAGGALAKLLPPFRLGLGGKIGNGRQMMSWIELDDLLGAMLHLIATDDSAGPVNAVAPGVVSNGVFTRTLGRVLGRPTPFPLPTPAVRLVFGQMGQELLLFGARVRPARLEQTGFRFFRPQLEEALRYCLGRQAPAD